jgi:hypothetical protein
MPSDPKTGNFQGVGNLAATSIAENSDRIPITRHADNDTLLIKPPLLSHHNVSSALNSTYDANARGATRRAAS